MKKMIITLVMIALVAVVALNPSVVAFLTDAVPPVVLPFFRIFRMSVAIRFGF